jgi:hypothetical protein
MRVKELLILNFEQFFRMVYNKFSQFKYSKIFVHKNRIITNIFDSNLEHAAY